MNKPCLNPSGTRAGLSLPAQVTNTGPITAQATPNTGNFILSLIDNCFLAISHQGRLDWH